MRFLVTSLRTSAYFAVLCVITVYVTGRADTEFHGEDTAYSAKPYREIRIHQ